MTALPDTPPPAPESETRLVQSPEEFARVCRDTKRARLLAVDTEAASFHRYRDRVYLLQLSTRDLTAVVDPLAIGDLAPFGTVLADPKVEVVFHDADYDLRLLHQEYGFRATNVFDTRIAAQLLNEPGVGLAALVEKYLGVRLDKRFQRADWSARPLSQEMLDYAATDTRHLPDLRDILREQLERRGRLSWAIEEFAQLEHVTWSAAPEDEPGFLRLKGAKALKGRQLAVLRELFEWREALAARLDRAAFRILNNEPMLAIAKAPPADLAALAAVKGVGQDVVQRRGKELFAAIQRGVALPEAAWPRVPRAPRRPQDPAHDARLDRLKAVRNEVAQRIDLAPGVLCPNGTLEAIARAIPDSEAALRQVPGIRQWQVEVMGDALLAALPER